MLVLDALFDHFQQISSNVEIIGSLVQCSPISAIDVRVGVSRDRGDRSDVVVHVRSVPRKRTIRRPSRQVPFVLPLGDVCTAA